MKMRSARRLLLAIAVVMVCFYTTANADVIYESATFAGAGGGGTTISSTQTALGSRFYIDQPVQVTAIGGYIMPYTLGVTYFGAIVPLDGPQGYPLGKPIDLGEVIASTVFELDNPARDYRIPLWAFLEPGYYAIILGTDNLGAAGGQAAMPLKNQTNLPGNLGNIYFVVDNDKWLDYSLPNRFVVEGIIVPEPGTILLLGLGGLLLRRKRG